MGIPLPENKNTNFPFHVFDRYEIHIQVFFCEVYLWKYHLPILIFVKLFYENLGIEIKHYFMKKLVTQLFKNKIGYLGRRFSKKIIFESHIYKDNIVPR